jgi:hypothetical protein
MKAFSIACEDAFHLRFKGISFQDDVSIHIWREGWNAAIAEAKSEIDIVIAELQEQIGEIKNAKQST